MRRSLESGPYTSKLFFEEKGTLCFLSRCCNSPMCDAFSRIKGKPIHNHIEFFLTIQILSFFYPGKGPYMIEWFRV
jgi:hypothetical protein